MNISIWCSPGLFKSTTIKTLPNHLAILGYMGCGEYFNRINYTNLQIENCASSLMPLLAFVTSLWWKRSLSSCRKTFHSWYKQQHNQIYRLEQGGSWTSYFRTERCSATYAKRQIFKAPSEAIISWHKDNYCWWWFVQWWKLVSQDIVTRRVSFV